MEFGIYGVSYKEADADVRDCTAFSDTQKMELYNQLLDVDITQAVILSTCNRSELYFIYEKEEQLDQIRKLFLAAAGKAVPLFLKTGVTAACYLFEVAAGYHSMVLGEDQILGQVQSCYQMANQCQACRKQLHRMFQSCFAAVKQLKTAYKISEHPISIAYLAVKNIRNAMSLRNASVLVIGSGEMAALMLQYLQNNGEKVTLEAIAKPDKDLKDKGVEWLNVFAVDNVLQQIADPVFVGATIESGCVSGSKVVRKCDPYERVGAMCLENGKPSIVEYYELTPEMAEAKNENGSLQYGFGVILNYLFRVDKLMAIAEKSLPLHVVEKKVPYIDEDGAEHKPETPNAYKFETLILDMVYMMDNSLPFEVDREKEFAPVKNATGTDSVETARALLEKNGIEI